MKTVRKIIVIFSVALLLNSVGTYAQTAFQNLDFESANLASIPAGQAGGPVPIGQALPGWSGSLGSDPVTQVLQNNNPLSLASIDILSPDWVNQPGFPVNFNVIQGSYSAVLQTGFGQTIGINVPVAIEQTGIVPMTAKAILFDASGSVTGGALTVAFKGQNLPVLTLEPAPNSEEYGVDISAFAGMTGQLTFSDNIVNENLSGEVVLDNISFSPNPVPEPYTWALLLCGAGLFGIRRRWSKH